MKEGRSQTGRGHGPEGDAALLPVEGEELQVELAGGGQHVARVGVDPAVGRDQGQGTPLAAGRVRDAGGDQTGPAQKDRQENVCSRSESHSDCQSQKITSETLRWMRRDEIIASQISSDKFQNF